MKNDSNDSFNDEFNDNSNLKSLEEFFNKKINNSFSPQEMMTIAISLNHMQKVLTLYKEYTDLAIFDVRAFIKKYPEYINVDFNNLQNIDPDILKDIDKILHEKDNEDFNKGSIIIKNIIKVVNDISMKLYFSYKNGYNENTPEDADQFFTVLDNCSSNSLNLLINFFTQDN